MSDETPQPTRARLRRGLRLALAALCVAVAGTAAALWLTRSSGGAPGVPAFRHALVVVFENKEQGEVAGNPAAPTFAELGRQYATLSTYEAVAHPSLPNYLALVSGSTQGIQSDCTSCLVRAPNLADTLERAG